MYCLDQNHRASLWNPVQVKIIYYNLKTKSSASDVCGNSSLIVYQIISQELKKKLWYISRTDICPPLVIRKKRKLLFTNFNIKFIFPAIGDYVYESFCLLLHEQTSWKVSDPAMSSQNVKAIKRKRSIKRIHQ